MDHNRTAHRGTGKERAAGKHPCLHCTKTFMSKAHMARHIKTKHPEVKDARPYKCPLCPDDKPSSFAYIRKLNLHIREKHDRDPDQVHDALLRPFDFGKDVGFKCPKCPSRFDGMRERDNHLDNMHCNSRCCHCGKTFDKLLHAKYHANTCSKNPNRPKIQRGYGHVDLQNDDIAFNEVESAINNAVRRWRLRFSEDGLRLEERVIDAIDAAIRAVSTIQQEGKPVKVRLSLKSNFHKASDPGVFSDPPGVQNTKTYTIVAATNLEELAAKWLGDLLSGVAAFTGAGSGWVWFNLVELDICFSTFNPLSASRWMQLSKACRRGNRVKKFINPKNNDNECFRYAVLAGIHPEVKDPEEVESWAAYKNELNMNGISYPVQIADIDKFERLNPDISVNVLAIDAEGIFFPVRVTREKRQQHVELMYVTSHENDSHYVTIINKSALLSDQLPKHNGQKFFCDNCLHHFWSEKSLEEHTPICKQHKAHTAKYPEEGTKLKFTKIAQQVCMFFHPTPPLLHLLNSCFNN